MPKRFYLSPVVGSGVAGDPYHAKVMDYGAHAAIIPSKPDGTPRFNWALTVLDTADQTAALADATLVALPDKLLTQTITANEANKINAALVKLGVTVTVSAGDTIRSILLRIGQFLDPNFADLGGAI